MQNFEKDLIECLNHLNNGQIILYPTDTVWGLGCDAQNDDAVKNIIHLKNRPDKKSFVILVESLQDIIKYSLPPSAELLSFKESSQRPVTYILDGAKNLSRHVINDDGSIAVRVPDDPFCLKLLKAFGGPIVSTSANKNGEPTPGSFAAINDKIKAGVKYIVEHRRNEKRVVLSSVIIRNGIGGKVEIIRK